MKRRSIIEIIMDDLNKENLDKERQEKREWPEYLEEEGTLEQRREMLEEREMRSSRELELAREKLEKQASEAELTPYEEKEAEEEKAKVKNLDPEGRIQRLLVIAREKGVIFAVKVARDLGDAYALDKLHDILAQGENYKKLEK